MANETDIAQVRKIIHIDMDAFFAAVEQRDHPEYRGKPVIVGGAPNSRGVVAACSYEARKFGIHSAMPSATAARLCPQAIFVKSHFEVYKAVSEQVRVILRQYADLVEPLSMDEAFLDVTDSDLPKGSATLLATEIRQQIKRATKLTASAGISYNKFLAKIATSVNKPDGQFTLSPEIATEWIKKLPIGDFYGVGKVTKAKMERIGIKTGAELLKWSKMDLMQQFGTVGNYYYDVVRGIDNRPVSPVRERKSISVETTFAEDISAVAVMLQHLQKMTFNVCRILQEKSLKAKTVGIKVKYANFQIATRDYTHTKPFATPQVMIAQLPALLSKTDAGQRPVRLLGVRVAKLTDGGDHFPFKHQIPLLNRL